jgi:hypothetical protein
MNLLIGIYDNIYITPDPTDQTGNSFVTADLIDVFIFDISFGTNIVNENYNIAVGLSPYIYYSTNGLNWQTASNSTTSSSIFFNGDVFFPPNIAYGNKQWIVHGLYSNSSVMYSSSNGYTFDLIKTTSNEILVPLSINPLE